MKRQQLKVRTLYRKEGASWDDDALGADLAALVGRALERRAAPPVAVCVREDRLDLFDLGQVSKTGMKPGVFLATLTRMELEGAGPIRAVGMMGRFEARQQAQGPGVPMAMVFLEWDDCRWWQWRTLLDGDEQLREETKTINSAAEGDAKPPRLGGWWSLGRRARLKAKMETLVH